MRTFAITAVLITAVTPAGMALSSSGSIGHAASRAKTHTKAGRTSFNQPGAEIERAGGGA
jgi:hypothetical protein